MLDEIGGLTPRRNLTGAELQPCVKQ